MRDELRHQACGETQPCTRLDPLPSAEDENDLAEQLGSGDGGIRRELCVAPGDQARIFGIAGPGHYAVRDESAFAGEKHDIACGDLGDILPVSQENVAGPNRREHAAAGDSETQGAKRAHDLPRKFALRGVRGCLRWF